MKVLTDKSLRGKFWGGDHESVIGIHQFDVLVLSS